MIRKLLYSITAILVIVLGYLVFNFIRFNAVQKEQIIAKGKETTRLLEEDINKVLSQVKGEAETLVSILESRDFTQEELEKFIKQKSNGIDELLGITIAYQPQAFVEESKLYAPYFDKNQNEFIQLEELYDYTDASLKTAQWYVKVRDAGAQWIEPYYGEGAKALIADYGMPFYFKQGPRKGELKGVVAMTISLKGFAELVHSLSLGKTGFGIVTSEKGAVLVHPIVDFIGSKNIKDLQALEKKEELKNAYAAILKGETGHTLFFDKDRRQETLFFYDTVPAANWRIGVRFFKDDLLGNSNERKRKYIDISIVVSVLVFFLLAIFYNRDHLSVKEVWYLCSYASLVLIANVFLVGYLQHTEKTTNIKTQSPPVTDNTTVSSIVNVQNMKASQLRLGQPILVPTGVFVDQLQFEDSYNVSISGRVWQKYDTLQVKNVELGFRFPQTSPFAESSLIEEAYREQRKGFLLIGYNFRTTLRMNFNYGNYPFDKRNINLGIEPANAEDNILLVPDLDSYTYTNPSEKSAVNDMISLSGNKIIESYFSYQFVSYETNFGYEGNIPFEETPELQFNITVKRVLITAFVTYLIPIFVTLIMMFILVYASGGKSNKIDQGGIVQGMTAFFFVLVFSHIDLRKNIDTADLIYMEYFYFITYAMVILSTYNLITYTRVPHRLFDYKENLIVKATFWPLFLTMVLVMTLFKFY